MGQRIYTRADHRKAKILFAVHEKSRRQIAEEMKISLATINKWSVQDSWEEYKDRVARIEENYMEMALNYLESNKKQPSSQDIHAANGTVEKLNKLGIIVFDYNDEPETEEANPKKKGLSAEATEMLKREVFGVADDIPN